MRFFLWAAMLWDSKWWQLIVILFQSQRSYESYCNHMISWAFVMVLYKKLLFQCVRASQVYCPPTSGKFVSEKEKIKHFLELSQKKKPCWTSWTKQYSTDALVLFVYRWDFIHYYLNTKSLVLEHKISVKIYKIPIVTQNQWFSNTWFVLALVIESSLVI